jgi:hypothetical protein
MRPTAFHPSHIVLGRDPLPAASLAAEALVAAFGRGGKAQVVSEEELPQVLRVASQVLLLGGEAARRAAGRLPSGLADEGYVLARGLLRGVPAFAIASPSARGALYGAWALVREGRFRESRVEPALGLRSLSIWRHCWEAEALRPWLERMAQLGLNSLQLMDFDLDDVCLYPGFDKLNRLRPARFDREPMFGSANLRDEEAIGRKREALRTVFSVCGEYGVDIYPWHHELVYPPEFRRTYPEAFLGNGKPDFDNPALRRFIRGKYDEVFGQVLPELPGVVITTTECSYAVGHGEPAELRKVMGIVSEACREHGKLCIFRTFAYSPEHNETTRTIAAGLPREVMVMMKVAPADFFDPFGHDPSIGNVGEHEQMIEFDLQGEDRGRSRVICWTGDYDKRQFDYSLPRRVRHAVARINHGGTSLFDRNYGEVNPNEANLITWAKLAWDPRADVRREQLSWAKREFGPRAAPAIVRAFRPSHEIVHKTLYYRRFALNQIHLMPFDLATPAPFAFSWLKQLSWVFQYHCWNPGAESERLLHMLLRPEPEHLSEFLPEKQEALELCHQAQEELAKAKAHLPRAQFANLRTYLDRLEVLIRLCRRQGEVYFLAHRGLPLTPPQRRRLQEAKRDLARQIPLLEKRGWTEIESPGVLRQVVAEAEAALLPDAGKRPPSRRHALAPPLGKEAARIELGLASSRLERSALKSGNLFNLMTLPRGKLGGWLAEKMAGRLKQPRTQQQWEQRRAEIMHRLPEVLGGLEDKRGRVRAEVLAREELEEHWREKLVIESRQGFRLPCFLYLPKYLPAAAPAILTVHGHGPGKSAVAGVLQSSPFHMHNYGWGLARRGYVTLTPDLHNMGERADNEVGTQYLAYALGKSLAGLRTWDVLRCYDYLLTRPEVDPGRIGLTGLSLGGTITAYAGALEPGFKVIVQAGYFFSWRRQPDLFGCPCNFVPDLITLCDLPEVDACMAPRPLMIAHGLHDWFYDNAGVRHGAGFVRSVYGLRGAKERFRLHLFPEGHTYPLAAAAAWFARWL